jgi:phytoene dehydrogenase-like protein
MVGQWVQPGGGLPAGVMTGRAVVQQICKEDRKRYQSPLG